MVEKHRYIGWLRVQDAKGKDKLLVGQTGGEVGHHHHHHHSTIIIIIVIIIASIIII